MKKQKHTVEVVQTDLEIDEHLDLHERGWKTQRFGWLFIFALVVLAALGVFGDGIASKKTVTQSGTRVEYDRFYRHEARMELRIEMSGTPDSQLVVALPNQYLERFKLESIQPEPKENRVQNDEVAYLFDGTPPMRVVFHLVPQHIGTIEGNLRINEHSIPLTHFIYP